MLKHMPLLASVSLLGACGAAEKPSPSASYDAARVSAEFLKGVAQHITPYDQPEAKISRNRIEVAHGLRQAAMEVKMNGDRVYVTTESKSVSGAPSKASMVFKIKGRRVFPSHENHGHDCNHSHPRDTMGTLDHPTTQKDVTFLMVKAFKSQF